MSDLNGHTMNMKVPANLAFKIIETHTIRGGKRQRQLNINITKKEKKQLIFVWSLSYNMSDLSGPTTNKNVTANLACKIIETHTIRGGGTTATTKYKHIN